MASGVSSSLSSSSLTFAYRRALDDRLTERDDLRVILDWLDKATLQWQHIGVQLGLEVHELNRIEKENSQDLKLCFQRVIIKRFQKGDLTWKILLQALESDAVGLKKLASETKEKLRDANSHILTDGGINHSHFIAPISSSESKSLKDGNNHDSTINMASPLNKSATSQLSNLNNLTSASPDLTSNGTVSVLLRKVNYGETKPRRRDTIVTGPIITAIKENELMGEHDSYHQRISAQEAERRLKKYGGNRCYLTRFSRTNNRYVLSVCQKIPTQEIEHYGIDIQDGKYKIQGKEDIFNDITQMFEHYEQKRLDPAFKNIGKMFTEEDYLSALNRNPLMGEHPSYHQSMSAEEAEQRLKKFDGDCCYLTRFCEADRKYMLSVSQKRPTRSIKHFQIEIRDGKCSIFEGTELFDDITQMLQHYEHNRLDPAFKTIGKMFTEDDYTIALNETLMEEHTSYHQTISAEEAEQRLKKCGGDRCYLTHYNEKDRSYMLSVHQKRPTPRVIKHFKIEVRNGKCNIDKKPDVFDDITQMLEHYEQNKLDSAFRNIGTRYTEENCNSSKDCQIL